MKKHLFPLLLLCLFSHTAYAQDDTEWFWALRENGELIAYSTDGDVNTLIAGGVESAQGHRLNHQSALVILTMRDDNRLYIYELTPTAAISQMSEWGAEELVLPIVTGIHFETYYPFATITIRPETGTVTALINFETDAVELIEGEVNQLEFSDDGERLSYQRINEINQTIVVVEHNLNTGAITTSEFVDNPFASPVYSIIARDFSCNLPAFSECGVFVGEAGNYIFANYWRCQDNCELRLYPLDNSTMIIYPAPSELIVSVAQLSRNRVLARDGSDYYWLLALNSPPQRLGRNVFSCGSHFSGYPSYEQWWFMETGSDNNPNYTVWDSESETFLFELEMNGCVGIDYFEDGFLIHQEFDGYENFFYRISDHTIIEFSLPYNCYYAVTDSEFLCWVDDIYQFDDIYSYDHRTGIYHLLVDNANPIGLVDRKFCQYWRCS
jgi:hypothetical protein